MKTKTFTKVNSGVIINENRSQNVQIKISNVDYLKSENTLPSDEFKIESKNQRVMNMINEIESQIQMNQKISIPKTEIIKEAKKICSKAKKRINDNKDLNYFDEEYYPDLQTFLTQIKEKHTTIKSQKINDFQIDSFPQTEEEIDKNLKNFLQEKKDDDLNSVKQMLEKVRKNMDGYRDELKQTNSYFKKVSENLNSLGFKINVKLIDENEKKYLANQINQKYSLLKSKSKKEQK